MIVKVWGTVNNTDVEFTEISDRPGYYEGFAPAVPGFQNIEIWAKNDLGAVGHFEGQVLVSYDTPTRARLVLTPFKVKLVRTNYSKWY